MPDPQPVQRRVFVDFMYAIVVGTVLPLVNGHLNVSDPIFYGVGFLIIVVLEDYFLYETQIARFQGEHSLTPISLIFEISILVCWYLSAAAIPCQPKWFLWSFALFFLLKFAAGWAHWKTLGRWESWRNVIFLLPVSVSLFIRYYGSPASVGPCLIALFFVVWLLTIVIWWSITAAKKGLIPANPLVPAAPAPPANPTVPSAPAAPKPQP